MMSDGKTGKPIDADRVCAVCGRYAGQMVNFVPGRAEWICSEACEEAMATPECYVLKEGDRYLIYASPSGSLDEWGCIQRFAWRVTRERARAAVAVRIKNGHSTPRVVRICAAPQPKGTP